VRREVDAIFTYHAHAGDAETVVAEVKDAKAVALQLDTGDVASFDAFVSSVKDALAKLGAARFDFLVNHAGNNHRNMPFEKATEQELDSIYNVHFNSLDPGQRDRCALDRENLNHGISTDAAWRTGAVVCQNVECKTSSSSRWRRARSDSAWAKA
jgi:NAD(P)-dependent dehydrogenase (short-subunit alcohol dehydrogenase family)